MPPRRSRRRSRAPPSQPVACKPEPGVKTEVVVQRGPSTRVLVQLVDESGVELPYVDAVVTGVTRRYYIGQAGQHFSVRVDWSEWALGRASSQWAVECEIDGRSVGIVARAGLGYDGRPVQTQYAFTRCKKDGADYKLLFGATTVRSVAAAREAQEPEESPCGHVRVTLSARIDLPGQLPRTMPSAPGALAAEPPSVQLSTSKKFWSAPSLGLSHSAPCADELQLSHSNYRLDRALAIESVYFDTAERLALRRLLPASHPAYPQQHLPAEPSNSRPRVPADRLAHFRSMLADPDIRATLSPMLASAAEFYVNNSNMTHTCDLTGDDTAGVWQASKRPKQERVEVDATA